MELPEPDTDQTFSVPGLEKNVNRLSEELHVLRQHVDDQFARQREYVELLIDREREHIDMLIERERERSQRVLGEFKAELIKWISEKFDAERKEADAKLTDFRKDMDRKFLWMIAGYVSLMIGLVGLYLR